MTNLNALESELSRHSWRTLRAAICAESVPEAVRALANAVDERAADDARRCIENNVAYGGEIWEATVPTTSALMVLLSSGRRVSRPNVLDLLQQIGASEPAAVELAARNGDLNAACEAEILRGFWLFHSILFAGTLQERLSCVDLLGICAERDPSLRERVMCFLGLVRADLGSHSELVDNWLSVLHAGSDGPA